MTILKSSLHLWGDLMADVEFKDFSIQCKEALNDKTIAWLYEAAGEVQAKTIRNSRVDTGQTKASYTYNVDEGKGVATIGSPLENAIWEEFGTGQYALNGDGRKTPWVYTDRKGQTHLTHGKKPNRPLFNAFTSLQTKLVKRLEDILKGMGT